MSSDKRGSIPTRKPPVCTSAGYNDWRFPSPIKRHWENSPIAWRRAQAFPTGAKRFAALKSPWLHTGGSSQNYTTLSAFFRSPPLRRPRRPEGHRAGLSQPVRLPADPNQELLKLNGQTPFPILNADQFRALLNQLSSPEAKSPGLLILPEHAGRPPPPVPSRPAVLPSARQIAGSHTSRAVDHIRQRAGCSPARAAKAPRPTTIPRLAHRVNTLLPLLRAAINRKALEAKPLPPASAAQKSRPE